MGRGGVGPHHILVRYTPLDAVFRGAAAAVCLLWIAGRPGRHSESRAQGASGVIHPCGRKHRDAGSAQLVVWRLCPLYRLCE